MKDHSRAASEEYVLCPYYRRDAGDTIGCEGMIDGTSVVHHFRNKIARKEQMRKKCCRDWHSCWYAKAMEEIKYG